MSTLHPNLAHPPTDEGSKPVGNICIHHISQAFFGQAPAGSTVLPFPDTESCATHSCRPPSNSTSSIDKDVKDIQEVVAELSLTAENIASTIVSIRVEHATLRVLVENLMARSEYLMMDSERIRSQTGAFNDRSSPPSDHSSGHTFITERHPGLHYDAELDAYYYPATQQAPHVRPTSKQTNSAIIRKNINYRE